MTNGWFCTSSVFWTFKLNKKYFWTYLYGQKIGTNMNRYGKKINIHLNIFSILDFAGIMHLLKKTYRPSTFSFILQTKLGKDWSKKLGAGDKKPSSDKLPGIFWLLYDCSSHLDRVIFPTSYRASCIYILLLLVFRKNIYI